MNVASFLLTLLGVLLTMVALGVSVAIYRRQNVEQMDFRKHLDKRFDGLMVERIDEEARQGSPTGDGVVAEPPPHVTRTIGDVSVIDPGDIPLTVLGDLSSALSHGEHGNHSGWLLGEIQGAYRRSGKGNHPWYVVLVDRDEGENAWIARLARGGYAKSEPTVTIEEAGAFFGAEV